MLAKLTQHAAAATNAALRKHTHCLIVLPLAKALARAWPGSEVLDTLLARRRMKTGELAKAPVTGNLQNEGETLSLIQPGSPEVVVDRVRYEANAPWPASPGQVPGVSLHDLLASCPRYHRVKADLSFCEVPPSPDACRHCAPRWRLG